MGCRWAPASRTWASASVTPGIAPPTPASGTWTGTTILEMGAAPPAGTTGVRRPGAQAGTPARMGGHARAQRAAAQRACADYAALLRLQQLRRRRDWAGNRRGGPLRAGQYVDRLYQRPRRDDGQPR